eukprot:scaffold6841_cov58-Attheya_sp.AAC.4
MAVPAKAVVALLFLAPSVVAFAPSGVSQQPVLTRSTTLRLSDKPSDPLKDDALSSLLNKRLSIKKPSESAPNQSDSMNLDENEKFTSYDDLGKNLKTKRVKPSANAMPDAVIDPALRARLSQHNTKGTDSTQFLSSGEENILDFTADYDDENELHIPNRMGFGTAHWGDGTKKFVPKGKLKKSARKAGYFKPGDLQSSYNALMEAGVTFLDTSEQYGFKSRSSNLSAEHILGRCTEENTEHTPIIASTYANPYKSLLERSSGIRYGSKGVLDAIKDSCARMETTGIELYQIQFYNFLYPGGRRALADGLATAIDEGHCNYAGLCNAGYSGMKSMSKKLDQRGHSLTSNQFAFSLTNRKALKSGLINACKDMGVIPFAHTPLDGGLASGQFTAMNPSGSIVGGGSPYTFKELDKLSHLHSMQETVAAKVSARLKREQRETSKRDRNNSNQKKINTEITTTQVAINYVIAHGAVPLPGIDTPQQAEELLGCLGWSLTGDELDMLDAAADLCEK